MKSVKLQSYLTLREKLSHWYAKHRGEVDAYNLQFKKPRKAVKK